MRLPCVVCKCGCEELYEVPTGPHIKLICCRCGRYIKFANKRETNIIKALTSRNPFNTSTR